MRRTRRTSTDGRRGIERGRRDHGQGVECQPDVGGWSTALKASSPPRRTASSGRTSPDVLPARQFGDQIPALNVFRYITFRTGGATVTAIIFVFLFGPTIIAALRIQQGKGQPIRERRPADATSSRRSGTPTMGGLMILSGLLVSTLLWANLSSAYVWIVLLVTLGFGADRAL